MRREHRRRAQYWPLLIDDPKIWILLQKCLDRGLDLFAIGESVVEELHQRDIALRIASGRRRAIFEELLTFCHDRSPARCLLLQLLLDLGSLERIDHDLRMLEEIIVNDALDPLLINRG